VMVFTTAPGTSAMVTKGNKQSEAKIAAKASLTGIRLVLNKIES
jgi:hypothetical protein